MARVVNGSLYRVNTGFFEYIYVIADSFQKAHDIANEYINDKEGNSKSVVSGDGSLKLNQNDDEGKIKGLEVVTDKIIY